MKRSSTLPILVILASTGLLLSASIAHATLAPRGSPAAIGSWEMGWDYAGLADVTEIDAYLYGVPSGEGFTAPPMYDFTDYSWTIPLTWESGPTSGAPLLAGWATGNSYYNSTLLPIPLYEVSFVTGYESDDPLPPDGLTIEFVLWSGNTQDSTWSFIWDEGDGDWVDGNPHTYGGPLAPIPEPASCALLALAVGGIGATLRRRKKK